MEDLIAQTGLTGIVLLSLYYGIRFLYLLATREQRRAKAQERKDQERETWIKRENELRAALAEAYEDLRTQDRQYLEAEIQRLEDQMVADSDRYDRDIETHKKTIATLDEAYQRLADRAQADRLNLENQIEALQSEITSLRQAYERSEKEREELTANLKETQAELSEHKKELATLKIDKAVLEKQNALLEQTVAGQDQQLDVLRGLIEPMRELLPRILAA